MKRIFLVIIFCLLFAWPTRAAMIIGMPAGAPSCDDCSGTRMLGAHFENNDDITQGTPCGCSDGDSTLSKTNATYDDTTSSDGDYSLRFDAAGEYVALDVSGEDIFDDDAGHITLDVYFDTWTNSYRILEIGDFDGDSDRILIECADNDELTFRYVGDTTDTSCTTNGADLAVDTWYTVTIRWQTSGNPNIYILVNSVSAFNNTDPDGITGVDTIYLGDVAFNGADYYIDNFHIWSTYAD